MVLLLWSLEFTCFVFLTYVLGSFDDAIQFDF